MNLKQLNPAIDLEKHFEEVREFLGKYHPFWGQEILNFYPETLENYPKDWMAFLDNLSEEELWEVDCDRNYQSLQGSPLESYVNRAKELASLNALDLNNPPKLPEWALNRVKKKKQHEIAKLVQLIPAIIKKYRIKKMVDIGSGIGHLSRTLAHYYGINCISLDRDEELQLIGKKRLRKFPLPEGSANVEFKKIEFGNKLYNKNLATFFSHDHMSVGLHTCGALAITHLKTSLEYKDRFALNFGCCYNKLDPISDINLSKFALKNPLTFSQHSLTLATRGHVKMTMAEFKIKQRVKYYRYALHLLLTYEFRVKEFLSAGEANLALYEKDFSDYALEKLTFLKIDHAHSADKLNHFFGSDEIQKKLRPMFLANIIRWQLGRVVELYILLDRALYLKERGREVQLVEVFDENISPRNIALMSSLPNNLS